MMRDPGKNYAVFVMAVMSRKDQICFVSFVRFWKVVPSIFTDYARATIISIWMWKTDFGTSLWKLQEPIKLPSVPKCLRTWVTPVCSIAYKWHYSRQNVSHSFFHASLWIANCGIANCSIITPPSDTYGLFSHDFNFSTKLGFICIADW